jgi:hypothetical protein
LCALDLWGGDLPPPCGATPTGLPTSRRAHGFADPSRWLRRRCRLRPCVEHPRPPREADEIDAVGLLAADGGGQTIPDSGGRNRAPRVPLLHHGMHPSRSWASCFGAVSARQIQQEEHPDAQDHVPEVPAPRRETACAVGSSATLRAPARPAARPRWKSQPSGTWARGRWSRWKGSRR